MTTFQDVRNQIEWLTSDIVGLSLCNHQHYPSMRDESGQVVEIGFCKDNNLSVVLKNLPYHEIYDELDRVKAYNLKMVDGALIQMLYRFKDNQLIKHRLAFFPSPYLEEYQNSPEIYENDELYAEVVKKSLVPFPFRFDFEINEETNVELDHPLSHLSIGQYINCRIPVSAPVTPYVFLSFILRNFYNTAYKKYCDKIRRFESLFTETIAALEKKVIHIQIPAEELI